MPQAPPSIALPSSSSRSPEVPSKGTSFEDAFSESAVIRALARLRVAQARRRRAARLRTALGDRTVTLVRRPRTTLDECFPPRSQWLRLRAETRRRVGWTRLPLKSLLCTVARFQSDSSAAAPAWLTKLRAIVEGIRTSALTADGACRVEPPLIVPLRRPDGRYRPISTYRLRERVIASLTARYLLAALDPDQSPCSFAYRRAPDRASGGPPSRMPSHHDAFAHLRTFRERFGDGPLWVGECDLHGFFDCLHHGVALAAVDAAIARAAARGVAVDPRARRIVESFLRSYTFIGHAVPEARRWFAKHRVRGQLHSCEERLRALYPALESEPVGVAQGNPLAGLLANLVLDDADRAVEATPAFQSKPAMYARYCDDMIVCHPTREGCQAMLSAYMEAAHARRLLVHPPMQPRSYDRTWWRAKSRAPYVWADKRSCTEAVPWVGFVGYQIRSDGAVRIRPSSVRMAVRKQADEVDRVIAHLQRSTGVSPLEARRLCEWVRRRMIARAVGRLQRVLPLDQLGPCWSAGFRGLAGSSPASSELGNAAAPAGEPVRATEESAKFIRSQLRELDRCRERQLRRLRDALRAMYPPRERGEYAAVRDGAAAAAHSSDLDGASMSSLGDACALVRKGGASGKRAARSRRARRRALCGYPYSVYGRFVSAPDPSA